MASGAADTGQDPRVVRTRAAARAATIELISEGGPEAVTFQAVAKRGRMSRATLYRHWPHPEELVFEALAEIVSAWEFSGPGRLGDEMIAEINRRRSELNQPIVRMAFSNVISRAPRGGTAAALRDRLVGSIAGSIRASIQAGVERGELRPGLDAEVLTAQVMGPMVWRSFVMGENVTKPYVERIVREALRDWEL